MDVDGLIQGLVKLAGLSGLMLGLFKPDLMAQQRKLILWCLGLGVSFGATVYWASYAVSPFAIHAALMFGFIYATLAFVCFTLGWLVMVIRRALFGSTATERRDPE